MAAVFLWLNACLFAVYLICPYLRLTAEAKIDVPDGTSLGFKPPAF